MTGVAKQSASLTAQNTFTNALTLVRPGQRVSVSISGTFVATVTLQRRLDETNWRDVQSWASVVEATYVADERQDLRIGILTGNFTSGTAAVRLGWGG